MYYADCEGCGWREYGQLAHGEFGECSACGGLLVEPVAHKPVDSVLKAEADRQARLRIAEPRIQVTQPPLTIELLWALGDLSPDEREVWVDRMILGRHLRFIAKDMDLTLNEVRTLEYQADAAIRESEWLDQDALLAA